MARAEAAARLHEHRKDEVGRQLVGSQVGGVAMPLPSKKRWRLVLVLAERDRLRAGQQHERAELVAVRGEHAMVEVGERHDQRRVVLGDERCERLDVAGIVDRRDERPAVGGVERRRELVEVDGERRRAGAPKRRDDVDALPRAGEEDDRHGAEGYSGAP